MDTMNELQIFNNPEFGEIRTLEIGGEPWFVGKDVATALGYKDTVNALKAHVDDEDKSGWRITTHFGTKETAIINESGLYSLIMSSKLEVTKMKTENGVEHSEAFQDFAKIVTVALCEPELVSEFNRLTGHHLQQRRTPIEAAIDNACGYDPDGEAMPNFLQFVWDCIYKPLFG